MKIYYRMTCLRTEFAKSLTTNYNEKLFRYRIVPIMDFSVNDWFNEDIDYFCAIRMTFEV